METEPPMDSNERSELLIKQIVEALDKPAARPVFDSQHGMGPCPDAHAYDLSDECEAEAKIISGEIGVALVLILIGFVVAVLLVGGLVLGIWWMNSR